MKTYLQFLNEIAASEPIPNQAPVRKGTVAGSSWAPGSANTPTEQDVKSLVGVSFRAYGLSDTQPYFDQKDLSGCAVDLKFTEAIPYQYNNAKDFAIQVKCSAENVVYGQNQADNENWKHFVEGSKSFMIYGRMEYDKGIFDNLMLDGYGGFYSHVFVVWAAGELVPKLNTIYKTSFNFHKWKKDPRYVQLYATKKNNEPDPEPTKSDLPKSPATTAPATTAPAAPTPTPQPPRYGAR